MEIIHIVLGKANPDRLNGVNKVVYNMATEQQKSGKNVSVWGITKNIEHNYPTRNFKTELFNSHRFPWFIDRKLKHAILQNKSAVFHLHGGWIPVFSSLAKFFKKHHIRYVLSPHGAYNTLAMKKSAFQKKLYFLLFEKYLIANVHKVHAIGKSEIAGLKTIYKNASTFLLPYGFEYSTLGDANPKNESFTIGFVGRLDTYTKGLDILIKAFYKFQKSHSDSILWIIGEGKLNNIVLFGKKFGTEKDQLIQQMHVFAHPSRNEGLPTAVLEAVSLGVPPIVTEATNIADYILRYNSGIAIADDNIDELTKAMERLYQEFLQGRFDQYVQNGKTMLRGVFYWPVLVEKLNELYQ